MGADAPVGGVPNHNNNSVALLSTSTAAAAATGTAANNNADNVLAPELPTKANYGVEGGWNAGSGPPRAAAYDSEEERLRALMPTTDESSLMEKRKLKAGKLISKKTAGSTLNPRKVQYCGASCITCGERKDDGCMMLYGRQIQITIMWCLLPMCRERIGCVCMCMDKCISDVVTSTSKMCFVAAAAYNVCCSSSEGRG